jgi:hypothetical protein
MDEFPPSLPHGRLEEIFRDIFFVTGEMKTELMSLPFQFSRNMTVVREGCSLTLVNAIRLQDAGLVQLEALGRVVNIIRLGSLHGRDDAFYKARYGAALWAAPGMMQEHGIVADCEIRPHGSIPFADCTVFDFLSTKMPECILHIDRAGGILVACDALQNLVAPDEYFSDSSRRRMAEMGFFQPANVGPVWMQRNMPKAADFIRLQELSFRHVLCGHGPPLLNTAKEAYAARFQQIFGDEMTDDARGRSHFS